MVRATRVLGMSLPVFVLAVSVARPTEPAANFSEPVKAAVTKALPLLWKGAEGHAAQRTCFACHNQGVPIIAFDAVRRCGFTIRADDLEKQVKFIAAFLERNAQEYRKGEGQGGQVDTAGYALLALELGGWKSDATTGAVAEYLLLRDRDRDHWRPSGNRPPSEASEFAPTYLAIRALRKWGTEAQKERIATRLDTVRGWLLRQKAGDTEDAVFRLWALQAVGAEDKEVRAAATQLLRGQRHDGGWGQTGAMESDAYATGTALTVLHEAGGLAPGDPAYQRGIAFLLKAQQEDGSWLVRSRSKPFQTYFESGFPHGKDQFISMAASGWATTALALALPEAKSPDGNAVIRAPAGSSEIVITTTPRVAGAIHSLSWGGKEFLDSFDHGRQLQSAANFDCGRDFVPEVFNPTEAGASADGRGDHSSSRLLRLKAEKNELKTLTQMAFWLRPGEKSEGHPAYNDKALSDHRLAKRVRIGHKDLAHAIEYDVTFTVPKGEKHTFAQFESVTGYMPEEFGTFWSYDPAAAKLKPLDAGPGEQKDPVVLATATGSHAMGVYSTDQPSPGFENVGYGRWHFKSEKVTKWNCVFRVRDSKGVAGGDYTFHAFVVVGSLADVEATLRALHKGR
jgi:hypothetical protein